ncbi:hypothetical protein [Streptomyces axinellae]|uniref:hypothetical protein n=1 Tax=Streptomyces axinellae TaxID=552788 RepID=UPI0031DA0632
MSTSRAAAPHSAIAANGRDGVQLAFPLAAMNRTVATGSPAAGPERVDRPTSTAPACQDEAGGGLARGGQQTRPAFTCGWTTALVRMWVEDG